MYTLLLDDGTVTHNEQIESRIEFMAFGMRKLLFIEQWSGYQTTVLRYKRNGDVRYSVKRHITLYSRYEQNKKIWKKEWTFAEVNDFLRRHGISDNMIKAL